MNNRRQIMRLAAGSVIVTLILSLVWAAGAMALIGLDRVPSVSANERGITLPGGAGDTLTGGYAEWTKPADTSLESLADAVIRQDVDDVTSPALVDLSGQTAPDEVSWLAARSISSPDSAALKPVADLRNGDGVTQPLVAGSVASDGNDLNSDQIQDAARWAGFWGVSLNQRPGSWQTDPCADGGQSGGCKLIEGNETPRVAAVAVTINEIRIDQGPSSEDDAQEYFELAGAPGTSLDGLTYLVIGDGPPGTGTGTGAIEAVVDLSGYFIPASGYFVAAEDTFTLGPPDLIVDVLNFEDSDNVTHLLVSNFTGSMDQDLDFGDTGDGELDITPWDPIVDHLALIEEENPPNATEWYYLFPPTYTLTVGPLPLDTVPSHAFLCPGGWVGKLNPIVGNDTPGAANNCGTPPVANDDTYSTNEDTILNVSAPGVLGNDTDADGDALTAVLDSFPSNGTLTLNNDGSFDYAPNPDYCGLDSFTYSNVATVTVDVMCVNDPPVADDDIYSTDEDTPLNVAAPGVLDGDTDVENDPLTAVPDSNTSHGSLTLNSDGSFDYIPGPDFCGQDSFTYHADDGQDGSNVATVTVDVMCGNDPPLADDDSYSTDEDAFIIVAAPGVLDNDTDVDGDSLTAVLDSSTSPGSLVLRSDGSFDYIPDPDFCGPDSFTYHANDGQADSNVATVTVDVVCVNDPPVADDDSYSTDENTPLSVPAPGVLEGDTDVEGDPLTAVPDSTAGNGTLILVSDGSFDYTPNSDFCGQDIFTYHANDGQADSNSATVTVDVVCLNHPPVIDVDQATVIVDEGQTAMVGGPVSDQDGDPLTLSASMGTVVENSGTWSWSFAASDGPQGQTVTITVDDGQGGTAQTTFELTVNNVAPTAVFANTSGPVMVGESAILAFSNQFDPSPVDTAAGFLYSYDCTDDGTFELSLATSASFACDYPGGGTFTARGRIQDKDGDFTDYTAGVSVLNTEDLIEMLMDAVEGLVEAGVLNPGQGNALITKLEAMLQQLSKDHSTPAINQVKAFTNQVNGLINAGILSPAEGQPLIDAANAIIGQLTS
jgi:predicted  nucleic acid-binding Zn-ribbon protein